MKSTVNLYSNIILEKLINQSKKFPDKICIESTSGEKLSYKEFVEAIDITSCNLSQKGLKKGQKVLFLAKPTLQSIISIFAVIRAGGVLVLADPTMGKENFVGRIEFIKPDFLMIDPILSKLLKFPVTEKILKFFGINLPNFEAVKNLKQLLVQKNNSSISNFEINIVKIDDSEDSMIIFTSGTTGTPKAVTHTYNSLFNILEKLELIFNITEKDTFYSSQLHFLLAAILTGSKGILPKNLDFDVKTYLQDLEKYNVNKTFGIPAEYTQIIDCCKKNNLKLPKTLNIIILGSAPVLKGFLEKLKNIVEPNTKVYSVYGGTEILPATYIEMRDKLSYEGEGDNLGIAVPGVNLEIVDDEIVISGNNLFNRYYSFPTVTKHFSGDLGKIDQNNNLILLGRKKDMIIRKNFNIYPTVYESTISKISGVRNCAMVGIYDEKLDDEKIFLAIEKEKKLTESDESFLNKINKELKSGDKSIDEQALPDNIILMTMPLSGRTFKIDKKKIKEYIVNNNLC